MLARLFVCPLCHERLQNSTDSLDQHLRREHQLSVCEVNHHIKECKAERSKHIKVLRSAVTNDKKRREAGGN